MTTTSTHECSGTGELQQPPQRAAVWCRGDTILQSGMGPRSHCGHMGRMEHASGGQQRGELAAETIYPSCSSLAAPEVTRRGPGPQQPL